MQPARDFVASPAKFTARVQDGHNHFEGGSLHLRMEIDRDAAPVVSHGYTAVLVDRDIDAVTYSRQGFVDRIIHDLINQMVQRLDIGAAHVHTWTPPDGFQAL